MIIYYLLSFIRINVMLLSDMLRGTAATAAATTSMAAAGEGGGEGIGIDPWQQMDAEERESSRM